MYSWPLITRHLATFKRRGVFLLFEAYSQTNCVILRSTSSLLDLFPDFRMRLKFNPRYGKVEYGADVHSVFDICWYTFARMIADTAPPVDYGAEDMFAQGSVLSCMACGSYFVRRSSRQRYCQRPECQAERNRKNRRASYARHKDD